MVTQVLAAHGWEINTVFAACFVEAQAPVLALMGGSKAVLSQNELCLCCRSRFILIIRDLQVHDQTVLSHIEVLPQPRRRKHHVAVRLWQ